MSLARELLAELTEALRADPRAAELLADELRPFLADDGAAGWLTTAQATAHLGLTVAALNGLVRRGDLSPEQPTGPGGRRLYARADLDAWARGR